MPSGAVATLCSAPPFHSTIVWTFNGQAKWEVLKLTISARIQLHYLYGRFVSLTTGVTILGLSEIEIILLFLAMNVTMSWLLHVTS